LLWEVSTGKLLRRFRLRDPTTGKELDPEREAPHCDYRDYCCRAVFAPDGKTLALGMADGSTCLCDVETGAEIRRLSHKQDFNCGVQALAFSPDGRLLAVGPRRHNKIMARLWDLTTGKAIREFHLPLPRLPGGLASSEVILPDGGAAVQYLDRKTGFMIRLEVPTATRGLTFSPDGKTLATSNGDKAYLWKVASGQLACRIPSPSGEIGILAFSSNGLLAGAGWDGRCHVWNWHEPSLKCALRLTAEEIERVWSDLGEETFLNHQLHEHIYPACRAIVTLAAAPEQAVELLARRLRPIESLTPRQLESLVADLDDRRYAVRERAVQRLATLAEAAQPVLRKIHEGEPGLEMKRRVEKLLARLEGPPSPERLRFLRGTLVLEYIGTEDARRALQRLAEGRPGAVETEEARAALSRLQGRKRR
jgi:hypothetical protein